MWHIAHEWNLTMVELQACFGLRSPVSKARPTTPTAPRVKCWRRNTEGRIELLGGSFWEVLTNGAAHVSCTLCILRWLSNSTKSSPKVARAMEAAFDWKEGPWPSDFITKDNLRALRLALGEDTQVVLVVGPLQPHLHLQPMFYWSGGGSHMWFWCRLVYYFALKSVDWFTFSFILSLC